MGNDNLYTSVTTCIHDCWGILVLFTEYKETSHEAIMTQLLETVLIISASVRSTTHGKISVNLVDHSGYLLCIYVAGRWNN